MALKATLVGLIVLNIVALALGVAKAIIKLLLSRVRVDFQKGADVRQALESARLMAENNEAVTSTCRLQSSG